MKLDNVLIGTPCMCAFGKQISFDAMDFSVYAKSFSSRRASTMFSQYIRVYKQNL